MSGWDWKTKECLTCGDKVGNSHRVLHYASKHEICLLCDFKNISKGNYLHMSAVHGWKVHCEYCTFESFWEESMDLHILKKHLICPECKTKFDSIGNLVKHQNTEHELRQKLKHCEICAYVSYPRILKVHMKNRHGKKKMSNCPKCDAVFDVKQKVAFHLKSVKNDEKFYCDECEFKFCTKSELQIHLRKDHPDIFDDRKRLEKYFTKASIEIILKNSQKKQEEKNKIFSKQLTQLSNQNGKWIVKLKHC